MRTLRILTIISMSILTFASCKHQKSGSISDQPDTFTWKTEQFADLKILRYQIPGFDQLETNQKILLYYLSQAAIAGRDILWDQNGKYNLQIRNILENIYKTYSGDRTTEDFKQFEVYLKRVWFSNGIYHHYSTDKILPGFSKEYFEQLVKGSDAKGFKTPEGKNIGQTLVMITPVMFDPNILPKRVSQDASRDLVTNSACHFYDNVSEKEASAYYDKLKNPTDSTPISYGLNSRLVKENGKLIEKIWKSGSMYGPAIDHIITWLEKAIPYAENEKQKRTIEKLIKFYKSGSLKDWDDYNIEWVEDTQSKVDFVNGFIEVYGDPLGLKASWESIVNFKDIEATKRTELLSVNAQWFENNSPVDKRFKKAKVKGVSAKVITAVQLGGDMHPSTAIGINLPNADWIRKDYGSKSVTIENITYSYDQVNMSSGLYEEFLADEKELELIKKYKSLSDNLHTDLHECLGHGSGQLLPGTSSDALKNYQSTLEETRADLFALYYIMDPKMVDLGILPSLEAAKAAYIYQMLNGLITQLVRIEPGKNIEEAHMRNRQLIAKWCYEKGKKENVIEIFKKNDKTYVRINDFEKLRGLFGQLLAEVQRIKSEGDYEAGKALVENFGVVVDQPLLAEAHERYKKLNLAPYSGFINPVLVPVEKDGKIIDVKVEYPMDFAKQMLEYSSSFSFLPVMN
jgi:dipeptidyl-peptidase III